MVTIDIQRRHFGQRSHLNTKICSGSARLEIEGNLMELALLNLAIDSKLRPCDLLRMRVCDISSSGIIHPRILFTQIKTQLDVQFEITAKLNMHLASGCLSVNFRRRTLSLPVPENWGANDLLLLRPYR